jgi:hypothetical protein
LCYAQLGYAEHHSSEYDYCKNSYA